jgi:hypothetical protein
LALTTDACRLIVHIEDKGYSKSIAVLDARAALEASVDSAHRETEDKFQKYIDVLKENLDNLYSQKRLLPIPCGVL